MPNTLYFYQHSKMSADFVNAYRVAAPAAVWLHSDIGSGLADSSGFIVTLGNSNYILTTAHSILRAREALGFSKVLGVFTGQGQSDSLPLPEGVTEVIFRVVGPGGAVLTKVTINRTRINKITLAPNSEARLKPPGPGLLTFDYKVEPDSTLYVGYCDDEAVCGSPLAFSILGYYQGQAQELRVLGYDGKGDIAVLVPVTGTLSGPGLQLHSDQRTIPIGTPIALVGNPLAVDASSISVGTLRDNNYVLPTGEIVEGLLTSVADFAGNSGSPYLLASGVVIGLNTYGLASDEGSTLNGGPGSRVLQRVLTSIVQRTTSHPTVGLVRYEKAYLGLEYVAVDLGIIKLLQLPMIGGPIAPGGLVVTKVAADSPLRDVLMIGDILLTISVVGAGPPLPLGRFPGQVNPSALTWFISPTSSVVFMALRYDGVRWVPGQTPATALINFPVTADIPFGPTVSVLKNYLPITK